MFRPRLLLFSSLLFLTSTSSLYSQDARGALVGTVSDTTGAVIAGVQVDVTNKAMGTKISLRTNEAGFYIANFLIPGTYSVSAEHPGFKKFVRDNVEVRVNDRIEVGVKLEVGSAEQSVTVTAETALLNTESASLGTVVDGRRVIGARLSGAHRLLSIERSGAASTRAGESGEEARQRVDDA